MKECQYRYSKRMVSFMQNTAKIVNRLLSLLAELPVLVVHKPPFGAKENAAIREDIIDYMVQRQYVQIWSQCLVDKYHSDFQEECSSQLFEDNTIFDQFPSSPAACLEHEIDDIEH